MNKKIVVTRSDRKSAEFIDKSCSKGGVHYRDFLISPLLEVVTRDVSLPDHSLYDALVITSANALHVLKGQADWLSKPLYIVGYNSSQAYKDMGGIGELFVFETVKQMSRELRKRKGGFFLYLRGRDVSFDLQTLDGISVKEKICYEATQIGCLTVDTVNEINGHNVGQILLFSKRAAQAFSNIIKDKGLSSAIASIDFLCMSKQVAEGLSEVNPERIYVANRPNQQGMIDLLHATVVG